MSRRYAASFKKIVSLSTQEKMKGLFKQLLTEIGEDQNREGLLKTPERAAKALSFMTSGYTANIDEIVNGAIYPSDNDEMVILKNIEMFSLCEHHLLPFFGKVHVAYLPNGQVIGISKLARIVDIFASRLQIQENLTKQIAECVQKYTDAKGVGIVIEAKHLCTMMRGVEKQNSEMVTSCMLGRFRSDQRTRSEFLSLIKLHSSV